MTIATSKRILCLALGLLFGRLAAAQEISVDWADRSVTSQPSEIHKGDTVKVTVSHVNDILYDYKVNVTLQIQGGADDLAQLGKLIGLSSAGIGARSLAPATCADA